MSTNTDLFGYTPPKLPRLLKVDGCAADRQTESERSAFRLSLTRNTEIQQIRAPIMAARNACREKQQEINLVRAQLASIKSRSKAAKAERDALSSVIAALRETLAKKKEEALLK